jgi:hypothetical protein
MSIETFPTTSPSTSEAQNEYDGVNAIEDLFSEEAFSEADEAAAAWKPAPEAPFTATSSNEANSVETNSAEINKGTSLGDETPARSRVARILGFGAGLFSKASNGLAGLADKQQLRADENAAAAQARAEQEAENARVRAEKDLQIKNQEDAYGTYAENIDATKGRERQEKIDAVKGVFRKFGRSVLQFPRRVSIAARVQGAVVKEVAGEVIGTTVDTVKRGYDAASDAVGAFSEKTAGYMDTVNNAVISSVEAGKGFVVDTYTSAKEKIGEKGAELKQYFADRKAAAELRKEARRVERAKAREVNERLVAAEVSKRLSARNQRLGRAGLAGIAGTNEN